MHSHSLENWTHDHVFLGAAHARNERRTWLVVGLTVAMMVAEIIGGTIFGSMALLADGWHMSTHAAAIGIAALAYRYARQHAHDPRFAFGTGKLGELAAFTSAVVLAMIALLIAYESVVRVANPVPIAYGEAIAIAAVGLAVNLVSAWLLREDHGHRDHGHAHDHHDMTIMATNITGTTATTILEPPICMCLPMPRHRCSPSGASLPPAPSIGYGSILSSVSLEPA